MMTPKERLQLASLERRARLIAASAQQLAVDTGRILKAQMKKS